MLFFFDPRLFFVNHATHVTHAKILSTHATDATHEPTHPRYPHQTRYLAISRQMNLFQSLCYYKVKQFK